jgi:DNA repair protein RecO (recombination protein O)
MSLKKEKGIVLESRLSMEADAILTVLVESGGKFRYILKGIKKSKTRPMIVAETGSYIHIDYYEHPGKDLSHCKEVSIIDRFEKAKSDYISFLALTSICELVNKLTPEGIATEPKIFEILKAALSALDNFGFQILLLPFFKLRFLVILGYISKEFFCHSCGEDIWIKKKASIESYRFYFYCGDCKPDMVNHLHVLEVYRAIFRTKYEILKDSSISLKLVSECDEILNQYLRSSLNLSLKSPELLYQSIADSKLEN